MSTDKVKKTRKPRKLSDAVFIRKYIECGERQAELARMLNVSRQTVGQRLHRIGKDKIEQARAAGQIAVAINRTHDIAFKDGREIGVRQWRYVDALEQVLADQIKMSEQIKSEIQFWLSIPGRHLKPIHLHSLLSIQQGIVRTSVAQHAIRKDISLVENFDVFCKATYTVMSKYDDDVVRNIYIELMKNDSSKVDLFTEEEMNGAKRD